MAIPRRFLPSMSLLTAFEAAARHESFTVAANELAISQSAVSRQIRLLEEQIGCQLFLRDKQTVRLSEAGAAYAREVAEALGRIGSASLNLRANPQGGTLNLAILPTFGTRWLVPRLQGFLDRHEGVTVHLTTKMTAFDFRTEPFDAAIHFGPAPWAGTEGTRLMAERLLPVASPDFLRRHSVQRSEDIAALPLLHLSSRPDQWERWFAAQDVAISRLRGMLIDQISTSAAAAAAGLGLALLPEFLIAPELQSGALVPAVEAPMDGAGSYHLVWPAGSASRVLILFRDWIAAETA